ncbi:D-amino-acid transaminase [Undibacter mobilis]|uniref:Probable branched-chain-amino-acid aminotransferase n=1 Tax=Undibacter mobilis TaxID=2292256 RepID=A0A371B0Y0_9BRAD|nr:D-amino-acid transaminase [Undibacter mobilis]RDV01187.1 D-amino-acid transaminase [Undibacter mobilis]
MSRIAYVNGRYLPHAEAGVSIDDRGFQFADSVYEVCEIIGGKLVDERRHMARLQRSLDLLNMARPLTERALAVVMRETIRRNRVVNGVVYVQVSRGAIRRDFPFPPEGTPPTLVVTARSNDLSKIEARADKGIAVVTVPDERWRHVDIKSVSLLPNVLAKQAARDKGAQEAWLVDAKGYVTEGASSSAWIVTRDGVLVTRPLAGEILPGVTRSVVLDLVAEQGLGFEERAFTVEEAYAAREAFITSASQSVMPVTQIDGRPVGNGAPGLVARGLRRDYHSKAEFT